MDWMTLDRLSHIRQQEILEQAARDREAKPIRHLLYQFGGSLITVGQWLTKAANREQALSPKVVAENYGYPPCETDAC